MTKSKLSEPEVHALRGEKQFAGSYARAVFQCERLKERIASLTLALQSAHKGIARLNKKVEYHRAATEGIIAALEHHDHAHILFKGLPKSYDGPKPGYEREKNFEDYKEMVSQRDYYKNKAMDLAVAMSLMKVDTEGAE